MKKTYQVPEIEVTLMEATELMQAASMGVYTEPQVEDVSGILSREILFDDED